MWLFTLVEWIVTFITNKEGLVNTSLDGLAEEGKVKGYESILKFLLEDDIFDVKNLERVLKIKWDKVECKIKIEIGPNTSINIINLSEPKLTN